MRGGWFIKSTLLSLILFAAPQFCGAYETDQFTNRLEPIGDSTELLNARVNLSIENAISNWTGPRNDKKVVNYIYHDIGGHHWVDKIERWVMSSDEVEHLQPSRRKSIYQGHPFWATRVAAIFGVGPTIKVNGQLIGSDKLGHFLSQGRKFYRRYMKSLDESQAAEHSAYTERALFGQLTTGVYSNADLVANYEGFLFYLSLFEDDVVRGKKAILTWEEDRWVIQRSFTWADHVNEYWDEALNVNHYDRLLYHHMQDRLMSFCDDYFRAPELYTIEDEDRLSERYSHLQLRDTSELRLDHLCLTNPDYSVSGVGGESQ
jgi:hypothetical protein